MKIIKSLFITVLLMYTTIIFAQEENVEKIDTIRSKTKPNQSIDAANTSGDEITFKNGIGNAIITITDEGSNVGSITLPSGSAPTPATNKLYNEGGTLKFSGSSLGGGSGATEINELTDAKYDGSSLFFGYGAGQDDDGTSNNNTATGVSALLTNTTGELNTGYGVGTLLNNINGSNNVGMGVGANLYNVDGSNNTMLGTQAGRGTVEHNKSGNIFIGYQAGYHETANDRLYINNDSSDAPLIFGNFTNGSEKVLINGRFQVNGGGVYSDPQGVTTFAGYFEGDGYFSGNVGIGVTDPTHSLQLSSGTANTFFNIQNTTTGTTTSDGLEITMGDNIAYIRNQENADLHLGTNNSNDLTIKAGGNVGIGVTNPSHTLQLSSGTANTFFNVQNTTTGTTSGDGLEIKMGDNVAYIRNQENAALHLGANNSTDLTIKASGNVGIGDDTPQFRLVVKGENEGGVIAKFRNDYTGNADGIQISLPDAVNFLVTRFIKFTTHNGNTIGSVTSDWSGGVSFNNTSDARLKMNIIDYENALAKVESMRVKEFEMKSSPGRKKIGFLAQELQQVYPQAVSGSPDSDPKTNPMSVDYSKLTPVLTKAIQELKVFVENQQKRIEELEKRIN